MKFPIRKPTYKEISVNDSKYELEYPESESNIGFTDNQIAYVESFSPKWKITYDGTNWEEISNYSSNELYVTWKKPALENISSNDRYVLLHTLFHLTCKPYNGITITDIADLTGSIWKLFDKDNLLQVHQNTNLYRRKDNLPLKYYGTYTTGSVNCPNLIKTGDGQCNSFAQLFLQMLRIQGYIDVNTGTDVLASPSVQSAPICNNNSVMSARRNLWFLVKKWGFTDIPYNSNLTNCTTMPFHIITDDLGNEIGGSSEVFGIQYHKTYLGYAADFIGNPGQNSVNPQSWFSYHSIIKVGSIYYDPSYGVKYQNSNDMRDNYLDGWCLKTSNKSEIELNIDVNRDGSINDLRFNIWSASNQANLFPLSFE